ncbi:unnamed protein product [Boreogadus saida]
MLPLLDQPSDYNRVLLVVVGEAPPPASSAVAPGYHDDGGGIVWRHQQQETRACSASDRLFLKKRKRKNTLHPAPPSSLTPAPTPGRFQCIIVIAMVTTALPIGRFPIGRFRSVASDWKQPIIRFRYPHYSLSCLIQLKTF